VLINLRRSETILPVTNKKAGELPALDDKTIQRLTEKVIAARIKSGSGATYV